MPQCKRDGCREEAQPYGKRLCPKHEAERRARSAAYFAKPKCAYCGTQHTDREDAFGIPECTTCYNARLERERQWDREYLTRAGLRECNDIESLKAWLEHHLLDKGLR